MKNLIFLLLITIFGANVNASTFETLNIKSQYEMSDRKPKKKNHKKKSHKKSKAAKKKGLVGHGCRGLKAHPNHKR